MSDMLKFDPPRPVLMAGSDPSNSAVIIQVDEKGHVILSEKSITEIVNRIALIYSRAR